MCTGTHPFIPAERTARLELICLANEQIVENVVYIKGTEEWNSASLEELVDNAITAWPNQLGDEISEGVQLSKVRATDVSFEDSFQVEKEPTEPTFGSGGADILPNNVTLATKFLSGHAGRSWRGRVYNIGLYGSQVTGQAVSSVTAGNISSNWASFFGYLTDFTDNASGHVVVSYCHDGEWREVAQTTPVTSYVTEVFIDSQRRRLTGRGL